MNKKIRILICIVCMLVLFCIVAGNSALAQDKLVMKVSGDGATVQGNDTAEKFKMFKYLTELYSDGGIEVKIFPEGTFGGSQEAVLAVRDGECHLFKQASNNFAVHAPSIWPFSFPYMFEDYSQVKELVSGPFGEKIQERVLKEAGVRVVGFPYSGWRVISNSVKPLKTLEDMKGLKIRVPKSAIYLETFKAWGSSPTPIGWNETFISLQQGVADGFDCPINAIGSFRFYEVQDYITNLKYLCLVSTDIINEQFWQDLSPKHKDAVQRALNESNEWVQGYVEWGVDKWSNVCKENGMEFYDLPPEEEARWKEAARAIWPKLYELADEAWVEEFLQAVEGNSK